MSGNLRTIIKQEYKKCIEDPIYFMKKYVKIQHPIKGTVNFDLYEFQESALKDLVDNNHNIILKSRQMGISTLMAGYSLWLMNFHKDKNILCLSITQETAKEIVTRVRFANDNLPSWLKQETVEDNRLSLRLGNGSQIKAASSASTAGRSAALSLLVIDECAFIDGIEDIWLSAQYTLSTGGRSVILSTPNGVGNFFHKTWVEAEQKENGFNTIKLPWYLHPDRDQSWRDNQTKLSGEKGAAQECDCEFETSGDQVINLKLLDYQKDNFIHEPIEKRGLDKDLWIWKYPDYSKSYIVSADCARGDGNDFSAFHIFDVETLEQVAEYKGKIKTKEFGNLLISISTEYNKSLLVVENSNIGWATLQEIIDRGYDNLFYNEMDLNIVDIDKQFTNKLNRLQKKSVPGFSTSMKNRPLMISKMETYFREKSLIINSSRLYDELLVFIWNGTKAEAMKGYNDDLVMSLAIALWIRDTALRIKDEQSKYNKDILSSIKKSTQLTTNNFYKNEHSRNSWKTDTIGGEEDLTWLL